MIPAPDRLVISFDDGGRVSHPLPDDDETRWAIVERLCSTPSRLLEPGAVWQVVIGDPG